MTKVQLDYKLARPLTDAQLPRVAAAHAVLGITRVQVAPSMDKLMVDYDASRLTRDQLEAALLGAGLAIQRRDQETQG